MARVGVIFNLLGVIVITLAVFLIGKGVFGIDLSVLPTWMQLK
jgi:hypothetical protein